MSLTNTFSNRRAAVTRILQDRLINAARDGHTAIVEQLLAVPGIDVNAKDEDGSPPLHCAYGHTAIVERLLAAGADVDARNNDGDTALMKAIVNSHTAIVRMLLAAGADVDARNNSGGTALMKAVLSAVAPVALVRRLLAAGADVNAKNNLGDTALMFAAFMCAVRTQGSELARTCTVDLLVAAGADVNAKNNRGETALRAAEAGGAAGGGKTVTRAVVKSIKKAQAMRAMNRWIPSHRDRQQDRIGFREFVRSTRVRRTYDGEEYEIDRLPRRAQTFIKGFL